MIDVAVVGLGNVGPSSHIPTIVTDERTELAAVADLDQDRIESIQADHDVAGYTDVEDMLESEDLDSVHVCTPPQTHADVATTCMEAGCAVLIEKPVAMDAAEVESLIETAEENDVTASVIHNKLFYPPVQRALDHVRSGDIGDVVSVDYIASSKGRLDETIRGDWIFEMDGAGMIEGLPHNVYLPLAFVDGLGPINCLSHRNLQDYDVVEYDGLDIEALDADREALISIKKLTNATTEDVLYVHGTEGIVVVDLIKRGAFLKKTTGGPSKEAFIEEHVSTGIQLVTNVVRNGLELLSRMVEGESGNRQSGHHMAIERYYDALEAGEEPPVTLEDGLNTMRVTDAVVDHMDECGCDLE